MAYPIPTPLFDTLENLDAQVLTVKTKLRFVKKDFNISKNFLIQYSGNSETYRAYRREIERLIQWSWLIAKKSILKLTRDDIENFIKFCQKPPKSWMSLQIVPKFIDKDEQRIPNKKWRPFVVFVSKQQRKKGVLPRKDQYSLSQHALQSIFDILNSFYTTLLDEDICKVNPVRQIKQKKAKFLITKQGKREIRRLSEQQWKYVLEAAEMLAKADKAKHERTLFIINALYRMYLRISELVVTERWQPQMGHFYQDSYNNWWFKTISKGNKERSIAVNDDMLNALQRYRESRNLTPLPSPGETTPLLLPLRGKGTITSTMQIRRIVQICFDTATKKLRSKRKINAAKNLEKATVHWLRHTGISDAINKQGRPIAHVRDDAGHSSCAVTDIYNDVELRERHKSAQKKIKKGVCHFKCVTSHSLLS